MKQLTLRFHDVARWVTWFAKGLELDQRDIDDIDEALDDEKLSNELRRKLLASKMKDSKAPLEMIAKPLGVDN